jgi:hypothetical protein
MTAGMKHRFFHLAAGVLAVAVGAGLAWIFE